MMASSSISTKEVEGESPNWLELPTDITRNILQRIDIVERVTSVCLVCSLWWNIYKDPLMWRTIQMANHIAYYNYYATICRYAIERRCDYLEDINIHVFGAGDLLRGISNCGSHLRRMKLVHPWGISGLKLSQACRELSQLEELEFTFSFVAKDDLETIGQYCPLLKVMKLSVTCMELSYAKRDDEAFAIAKTMPGLRYLKISGILLTNDGVLAILDGCPLLESLDLEGCVCNKNGLSKSLRKQCHERIKDLELPDDNSYYNLNLTNNDEYIEWEV